MIIGAICFNNLLEIKSTPELNFGLSLSHVLKIYVSEILENSKFTGLLSDKKASKAILELPIFDAKLGPTPEKKLLNPFAISKYSLTIWSLSLKKSGI